MNKVFAAMSLMGALALVGLVPAEASAQGCCGLVTSYRMGSGRSNAGRPFLSTRSSRATPICAGCMNMHGMNMQGMNMSGMYMNGMTMNGVAASQNMASTPAASAAPATRGAAYFCPMHPSVVSNSPATCPYCQMALRRR